MAAEYISGYMKTSTKVKVRNINDVEVAITVTDWYDENDTKGEVRISSVEAALLASAIKHNADIYFHDSDVGIHIPQTNEPAYLTVGMVAVYVTLSWLDDFVGMMEDVAKTTVW